MRKLISKTTHSMAIFSFIAMLFCTTLSAQTNKNFTGKYSSEGETTVQGTSTLELTQTGVKIEGVFNYASYDGQVDTGMLSVNGYVKDGIAYVRFRDQKGNTVGDGSLNFQSPTTLHFKQSTKSSLLPAETWMFSKTGATTNRLKPAPGYVATSFAGQYSNEGDTTAKGIIAFKLSQTGAKIEGTATYQSFDDSINSGVLSVNGYVKDGIAYIRFRDQKGNTVADGALHYEGKNIVFRQTTLSDFVPHYAVLYK